MSPRGRAGPERGGGRDRTPPAGSRILVVGPAWIGDMVMAQSLFRVLRERRPRARIDVLAPEWSRGVVRRMPEVSGVIPDPIGHGELKLGVRWRIARRIRRRRYRQAVVLRRSLKSALIPWMARIPRRTGFLGEWRYGLLNDVRDPDGADGPLTAQRYALLGLEPGERPDPGPPPPRLRVDPLRQAERIRELGLDEDAPVLGLAPGAAYGPAKRWPLARWKELARDFGRRGWAVWVFGSDAERSAGRAIREAGGSRVRDLTGRTSLPDVVDLMARCRSVVSNDSGLMHVASGIDVHVVAIFGSTTPRRTPPLTARRTLLWRSLPCSPCFERSCPLGHRHCLWSVGVREVRAAVLEAEDRRAGAIPAEPPPRIRALPTREAG